MKVLVRERSTRRAQRRARRLVLAIPGFLAVAVAPTRLVAQLWGRNGVTVTPIGTAISPRAVNDGGEVAGDMTVGSATHAARWTPGGGLLDLGTLGGDSHGYGINNLGQVAGASVFDLQYGYYRAFLYADGVGMQNLGVVPSGGNGTQYGDSFQSGAYAIDDAGQVTGYDTYVSSGYWYDHAFRYTPGDGMVDLDPGGTYADGLAIDGAGQVAGKTRWGMPARYTDGVGWDLFGQSASTGGQATGMAMNASGQMAVSMTNPGSYWAYRYTDGLGAEYLDGYQIRVTGMDDTGRIVGRSWSLAYFWEGTSAYLLQDVVGGGWSIGDVMDISDDGSRMVAQGSNPGLGVSPQWLLLSENTETPEPTPLALFATGLGALGIVVRRRVRVMREC